MRFRSDPARTYPVVYDNKPVHTILTADPLPGEVFRQKKMEHGGYPFDIECSNLGRVKLGGEVLAQREQSDTSSGYLVLDKPGSGLTGKLVYQVVADVWVERPATTEKLEVHHLTNDGYDNRPSNLMWLPKSVHASVHAGANW